MGPILLDLIQSSLPIAPNTPGDQVYERFQAEPDALGLAVVDSEGRPIGMVERNAFFLAMAAHYGRALYARRPISLLMNAQPLVVEADVPVADFCDEALAERPSELLRGFIVTHGGRYAGVGSALSLLQATTAAAQAHAEEMTRLAGNLHRAKLDAQAALTAKSQFLAVMSHEIRTPLNGVLAIADILQRKLAQPELSRYVQSIQDSGQTLLRLLTDALDLSRAEAGRLDLTEESLQVADLTRDLSALWSARAELKGLELDVSYDGDPDLWALGDPIRIKQIFNNLVGNALKFTDRGKVEVRLSAEREGDRLHLKGSVRDTGVGVPADKLATIFQPFSQTEVGMKHGGAGLGLSICRQLVEQMGGTIEVRNDPEGGSRFSFDLPLLEVPAPSRELCDVQVTAADADCRPLHVLVADDNPTNRLVAETLVEMFGATSESVEDGVQAVEAVRQGRFDLILMDIRMPNMDGVEATRAIRAMPAPQGRIPILALTANADPGDAAGYIAQGMDGVVEKPIRAERLMQAINGLFETDADAVAA